MVLWFSGSLVPWFSGCLVLWFHGSLVLQTPSHSPTTVRQTPSRSPTTVQQTPSRSLPKVRKTPKKILRPPTKLRTMGTKTLIAENGSMLHGRQAMYCSFLNRSAKGRIFTKTMETRSFSTCTCDCLKMIVLIVNVHHFPETKSKTIHIVLVSIQLLNE